MEPVEISAGRLHLRPWTPYDVDVLVAGNNDPLIQRWTRVPAPYTRELAVARIAACEAGWASGKSLAWAVCGSDTGRVLAAIDLRHLADDTWDVGFLCFAWARGDGVVPEALGAVTRWAFASVGASRVEWRAVVGNDASRRAAEKAGVVVEGVLRGRHAGRDGDHADTWVGSLVPSDVVGPRA